MERIETTILRNLVFNEDYSRKVIPFIQPDYFEQKVEKVIFEEIVQFIVKYGSAITIEALNIEVENRTDLTEEQIKEIREINKNLNDFPADKQWLLDTTERWCRDRAIYLGNLSILPMEIMTKRIGMQFPIFFQMLSPYLLIIILDMTIYKTMKKDMSFTTEKKTKLNLILNTSIKSRKVVSLTKLLTSLLLVRVSENLYSCAMWLAPSCSKDGTFCTLRWKWQKNALLKELMQTF
jgi:hypothetical protein